MKQYGLFVFLVSTFLSLVTSCKNEEENEISVFDINTTDLNHDLTKDQTSLIIPVSTNLPPEAWTVNSNQPWCLVTKDFTSSVKAVKIVVKANEEPEKREADITVNSSINNYNIKIRQLGHGPAILVKEDLLSIDASGGELKITVTANVSYTVTKSPSSDWITEAPSLRGFTDKETAYLVAANPGYDSRTAVFTYTYDKDSNVNTTCTVTQKAKDSNLSDVVIEGDKKIKPTHGIDSEHQPNYGIDKSIDGKADTHYHSIWYQNANFPVILEYFFDGTENMDYILYHTRNGNGNFGELDVYATTINDQDYLLIGSYDFKMQNASSKIIFPQQLQKVTKIKFAVKSGSGEFVSCSEMEFYKKNTSKKLDEQLLTVFKDLTCSELKDGVTNEQINILPGYFANIAFLLKNNTYNAWEKEFRIQSYQAYSNPEEWSEKLMTKKYTNLDNPTGIYVEAGDSVIALVSDTHGQPLSIQCIGDEQNGDYLQTATSGEIRFLEPGVNKIGFSKRGMLFIMYNTDLTNTNAKPVKIHIPAGSGQVSGFFDLKTHATNDKYKELIEKAKYKYFCVRGEKIMFYFHRDRVQQAVPYDILSAINLWDNLIGWQQELMGIEDVRPSQFNNHILAISPEGSYMWASDYRIGFVYTYLNNILLYNNVMASKDNAWGPAHEIGHVHQKAINWPGSTESSNNLFSNYILYKLGKYCSRGSELSALATARCLNNEGWWNMGSATHQNEDTELHMRMNWQLWNYYHRCGYKPDFWQTLFKLLRNDRIIESNPGAAQLKFARLASRAANENLTEFFERWGFFIPVDATIEQYGTWNYRVTETMIRETQSYMAQFPAPKHAFYYLEDRKNGDVGIENYKVGDVGYYTQFRDNVKITKAISAERVGRNISIRNGDEAVTFEVVKNNKTVFFSNFLSFDIPASITLEGAQIHAVQADGKRILIMQL
jgi:hypothetical protein